ncbi:hypothetical protein BX616_001188 [Lobosporangium transversale]|uniref:WD40 repeat-like protein n=1 Tax=Lobosporangium transversale TaxID=64571 RepID=A0A1Y2GN87_9FUNG|nr:WD40 repeat-like protein [Lobosporangium transversale]KAF9919137.1 hypothetical protein BX616_001188 [Lobosporangium transversale]ORZ16096.1 WD40 repeat-like protein [Lobosporangium transversale]|eukprot:XP_021881443.1 WD40 repeat-like protein [Lobosporangium transversale]
MVKAYQRYTPRTTFGVVASGNSNIIYDIEGKYAISPALEDVCIWDLKRGERVGTWHDSDNKAEVTCIARNTDRNSYAVGYANGSIRIWSMKDSDVLVTFNGHRSAVTALAFDKSGSRLVSGSKDTDLIVWDVEGEVGLYRLRGHKDQITSVRFLSRPALVEGGQPTDEYILSGSKDTLIKLWDLSTQHCMETLVAHRNEVWDCDVNSDETILVSGGGDPDIKVWKINADALRTGLGIGEEAKEVGEDSHNNEQSESSGLVKAITFYGSIPRQSKERVTTLKFHSSQDFLGCQASDKSIELFRIRSVEEIKKKMSRRRKRQREKQQALLKKGDIEGATAEEPVDDTIQATDEITPWHVLRSAAKFRSFDFAPAKDVQKLGHIQLVASLNNNTVEVWSVPHPTATKNEEVANEPSKAYTLELAGHRSDIRAVALSSDDELLCSASNGSLKIWNVKTTSCIRTMDCGYALCCAFLPGNRHVIVGTKTGHLELFDLGSSSMIESIEAHEGAIWSLQVRPDRRGLVTGSADKDVKFWDFDMVEEQVGQSIKKRLSLVHMRTLKMSDDVLCVRYSPDQKIVAVSLLDATVKVFYHDTLKFFLSLYGHKLPVLSMDISSDSNLLVTCSADKNVKLWGLDFGDCHKSLFAHQESVMAVQFVWNTHYFFTASKDRTVKYWDGDKFENILKLEGHHGEVWALAVGTYGNIVVSASHDRSLRIWQKTEDQVFLEEEREQELDDLYEATLTASFEKTGMVDHGEGNIGAPSAHNGDELASAGKQTMETLKAGERIMEALELADQEINAWKEYNAGIARGERGLSKPQRSPLLISMRQTPEQHVWFELERIRPAELDEALLVLPFSAVTSLLNWLDVFVQREYNINLVCRVLFFLVKSHHNQIVANRIMRPMLDSVRRNLRIGLQKQKDVVGFNVAALNYIHRDYEANNTSEFFDEDAIRKEEEKKQESEKKRKFLKI